MRAPPIITAHAYYIVSVSKMQANGEYCIHGHWEGDICVCEKGYKTVFNDEALHPSYCSEAVVVVVGEVYDGKNLFHLLLMAVSMTITYSIP